MDFNLDAVAEIEVSPVEMNGVEFVSFDLTFLVKGQPLAYRFITSHSSETEWLTQTAKQIGDLLGLPVENRLQPQTASR